MVELQGIKGGFNRYDKSYQLKAFKAIIPTIPHKWLWKKRIETWAKEETKHLTLDIIESII